MKRVYRINLTSGAAAAAALFCVPWAARAADTVAVISADAPYYQEAYAAFSSAFGGGEELLDASAPGFKPPEDARYAVAFGARAAALQYPPGTSLVYALAPITSPNPHWHQVSMAPQPARALAAYRKLQPGLRRLAVFWAVYPGQEYLDDLREAGDKAGIEIVSARLKSPDSIPERLRGLLGKIDAFWLMPDPALITQSSLMVFSSFSCANSIPFYAPTFSLVQAGAAAAFSHDFSDAGAAAAGAITSIRAGEKVPHIIYTGKSRLIVNGALIEKCRWPLKR